MVESQEDRQRRVDRICQLSTVPGTVTLLLAHQDTNVTFCPSYKAASTYWRQIFRFLHKDVNKPVERPSQISKYDTHLSPYVKTKRMEYFNEKEHLSVLNSFKFMMARDPYQRLWSVYVDKFILLDNFFWNTYVSEIIKLNNRINRRQQVPPPPPPPATSTANKRAVLCANVTFTEFLTYLVTKGQTKPENLDPHMRPIHYGCNPCIYRPDFIGKVETLTKEKDPILSRLGLKDVDDVLDFKTHVTNEISMITEFEYKLWSLSPQTFKKCMTEKDLEKRIIHVFIINGYLPEDVQNRLPPLPLGQQKINAVLSEIFLSSSRDHNDVRIQRERLRAEAYESVPRDIIERVRTLYKFDFDLFGYDPNPKYIFKKYSIS